VQGFKNYILFIIKINICLRNKTSVPVFYPSYTIWVRVRVRTGALPLVLTVYCR